MIYEVKQSIRLPAQQDSLEAAPGLILCALPLTPDEETGAQAR